MSRKSRYSSDLAQEICNRIIDGLTLRQIAELPGMPGKTTIMRWLGDEAHDAFRDQYARARELWCDLASDELLEIADDACNDWVPRFDHDGNVVGWRENSEEIRRAELQISTRKWLMSKRAPKKWGSGTT